MKKLSLLFILLPFLMFSQKVDSLSAHKVWDDLISAIGNNNPRPPKLIIKDRKSSSAVYSPKKKTNNY